MKNIVIAGSTGMIGNLVLQKCLLHTEVAKVVSIVRRKTQVEHPKLLEVVHTDFLNLSAVTDYFKNTDVCFYCIGVYTGTVSREDFHTITVDYTKAFATILKTQSPEAAFCFLSGEGADQTGKSRLAFAKDKGAAENFLLGLNFPSTYLLRPGYIYPVKPRNEPNFFYRLMRAIYPFLNAVYRHGVITSEELANAMVNIGLNGGDKKIYENKDLRERSGKAKAG